MSQTEVQLIKDAVIVNADVSGSAAIDVSKISGALPAAGGTITGDVTFDGETAGRDIVFDRSDNSLEFADNAKARFGNGADLEIYHGGTNSIIQNTIGDLYQKNTNNLFIQVNNTEAAIYARPNAAVELYYDGSIKIATTSGGATVTGTLAATSLSATGGITGTGGNFILGDSSGTSDDRIKLGASQDLQIYHDGSNSVLLDNGTGNFKIYSNGAGVDIQKSDGENMAKFVTDGAVELYHNNVKKFETASYGVSTDGLLNFNGTGDKILIPDSGVISLGGGGDLKFYHTSGSANFIQASGGHANIHISNLHQLKNQDNNEFMLTATNGGSVDLYHDNSKKFETTSGGSKVTGFLNVTTGIHIPDGGDNDGSITIGSNNDLRLYHDGSNSFIKNNTGELAIYGSGAAVFVQSVVGENAVKLLPNAAVELYYDTSKKFETLSDGVNVTGTLKVNGSAFSGGKVLQVLQATSNNSSTSSGSFQDAGLSKSITMTSSGNKILAIATGVMNNSSSGSGGGISIFRGSTNLAHSADVMGSYFGEDNSNNIDITSTIHVLDSPGAGTHTYAVKLRAFSGTQRFGYRNTGVLTVIELDYS